ncbi:MAG TPA: hypothetical protein ENN12_00410 [Epsilonproteobacteria bacterium]|nr:hypothetical protein [Campylobacterota bacterium]
MKLIFKIVTAMFFIILLAGCSQKAPAMNGADGMGQVSDAPQFGDTVSINENSYGSTGQSGAFGNNRYNSSTDGFQSIYFGFDNYSIGGDMQEYITHNAAKLRSIGNATVRIEGNCDEFGTDEYNYALGLKRAKSVKDSLIAQGIPASRMSLVSFGESSPVCNEPTDECYARNRRVDLRIVR